MSQSELSAMVEGLRRMEVELEEFVDRLLTLCREAPPSCDGVAIPEGLKFLLQRRLDSMYQKRFRRAYAELSAEK